MARLLLLSAIVGTSVLAVVSCVPLHHSSTPTGPSDANIAAMLLTANNVDIAYAELVPTRSERADVKDFAQHMRTDHQGVNDLLTSLLAQINLTPEENIASLDLRDDAAGKRAVMHELSGHAFDSVYIANEVSYHTKLLTSIDSVLAPDAHNPQLKQLILNIRRAVAAHLERAQAVRAAVAGGSLNIRSQIRY